MKKVLIGISVLLGCTALALALMASSYEPKVSPGTYIGKISVGGLSRVEAAKKVRQWWETEKVHTVELSLPKDHITNPDSNEVSFKGHPSQFGITVDDQASVRDLPQQGFWDKMQAYFSKSDSKKTFEIKFKNIPADLDTLKQFVANSVGEPRAARVVYQDGSIKRTPEVNGYQLDDAKLPEVVLAAIKGDGTGAVPITEAPKHISDDDLNKITEVMSEFTTKYSARKATRCSNIHLAAKLINGVVLAPGEVFSFNDTVGRRTAASGFKEAGVYKNGKHDTDFGGGICQVSTTLYNASLFANLKIKQHQNHSMPVPYVPLGRDATVDYGSADLKIQNTTDHPIAITSETTATTITFRILGIKDNSIQVKLETADPTSWDTGEQEVPDPTIPAGKTKVIEKGCTGRSISAFRLVYKDGQLLEKQSLGRSVYRGAKRIVAIGTKQVEGTPIPAGNTKTVPETTGGDTIPIGAGG